MSPTAPLDVTHADSIEAVRRIRERAQIVREQIDAWEPLPCPSRAFFK